MKQEQYFDHAESVKEKLYRTAYLYLGSESAAVDAVDEAVYKGYLACKKVKQDRYFATWLTRILINVCCDELRRRKRECTTYTLPENAEEDYDALPLKEAVQQLPEELRSMVVLRYFCGFTLAETARALCIPEGTVSSRQRKALHILRLDLTDEEVQP